MASVRMSTTSWPQTPSPDHLIRTGIFVIRVPVRNPNSIKDGSSQAEAKAAGFFSNPNLEAYELFPSVHKQINNNPYTSFGFVMSLNDYRGLDVPTAKLFLIPTAIQSSNHWRANESRLIISVHSRIAKLSFLDVTACASFVSEFSANPAYNCAFSITDVALSLRD
ncbi:hypothetical protein Tco_0531644 [Tanacetum coccineum]